MGRELKRVPLDFDWPLNKTWDGYLLPMQEGYDPQWEDDPTKPYEGPWGWEVPTGEGYQLWETTSEGSPQSPVFSTLDDLCRYAEIHCTTFASHKTSAAEWRRMLTDGFVMHREGNAIWI